jgi:hypothetical protein
MTKFQRDRQQLLREAVECGFQQKGLGRCFGSCVFKPGAESIAVWALLVVNNTFVNITKNRLSFQ